MSGLNILVTGGAGYLGSVLVPALLEENHNVTVLDNFLYGQNSLAAVCIDRRFELVRGDVRRLDILTPLLRKADVVIPLAALVGAPLCAADPVNAKTTNHDAVIALLKALSPNQRVLFPTTNSAYGKGYAGNHCDEKSPLRPISLYAKDKVEVEKRLLAHGNSISFRLATVFGMSPRMRLDLLVNDFTYRAARDGFVVLFESQFKRNYLHVRDVARIFLHGIKDFESMKGEVFNVGLSDANISKKELCHIIKKFVPTFAVLEAEYGKDPDQRDYIVSNAKVESTGFRPKVSLEDGVRELLKGFEMIRNSRYGNF